MTEKKTRDIVVAGAGMGGLSCALAFLRQGHRVRIIERARALRPVGAAISVWPNGVKILRAMGLGEALDAVSGTMDRMSYTDHHGQLLTRFDLTPLYDSVGEIARPVARVALQTLLLDAVDAYAPLASISLGVACTGFDQSSDGVNVHLSDGTTLQADLFIASDGTHSLLRNAVTGREINREYRGYVNWNGRMAAADAPVHEREWAQFVGDGKRVSMMPMGRSSSSSAGTPTVTGGTATPSGNDECYFFFDVPLAAGSDNDPSRYQDELRQHFSGWPEAVSLLIDRLDPSVIARVEIHDVMPLDQWVNGRVALLGDAAHAMAPDLGQGGCQAIEDAWVLAECVAARASEGRSQIENALADYQRARLERVVSIVERARKRAEITHGVDPVLTGQWYRELASETGETVIAGIRKTIVGGPLG
jgi:FAD-dependent urate hydroxylase